MIHRGLCLLFLVWISSCGEREKPEGKAAADEKPAARTTRPAERELEEAPDAKVAMREALDQALKEPEPAAKQRALEQIAWDAIDVDPAMARDAFEGLEPDSEASRKLVAHFAGRLADTDPEQAIEWAQGLEQPQERAEAFGRISVVIAAKDPARGAALAMEEMPAGISRDRAVVLVMQRWAQAAPGAAADWIVGLPAGAARSAGLREIIARWPVSDAGGLTAWIEGRTEKDLQMEGMVALAGVLRRENEEQRELWLSGFHDPEIRRKTEILLAQPPP